MPETQKKYETVGRGVLFRQTGVEQTSTSTPPYTGSCEIDGTKYNIAAWLKTAQSGKPFFSLSFSVVLHTPTEGQPE